MQVGLGVKERTDRGVSQPVSQLVSWNRASPFVYLSDSGGVSPSSAWLLIRDSTSLISSTSLNSR